MTHVQLLAFLPVAVLLVVTPGPDTALLTRNALRHGRRAALETAAGVNVGIALWTVAAALGLAAVVRASATAFDVLRLAGAAYLVLLGLQALWVSRHRPADEVVHAAPDRRRRHFRQGLVSNLLNPKIAVLFTSLLPQFVERGGSTLAGLLLLGAVFNLVGIVWLTGYAIAAARAGSFLRRGRVKQAFERFSGLVLVGLGIRLAVER